MLAHVVFYHQQFRDTESVTESKHEEPRKLDISTLDIIKYSSGENNKDKR